MDEKMNVLTSIKTNYTSWTAICISICIVSYPFVSAGFITFVSLLLLAYFVHRGSHDFRNAFTILHHYHHENNNFFSHFSQILLELSFITVVMPFYYVLGDYYVNIWTAISFILFYSTVHNFNYGQLRINDVHFLHHKDIYTNIGPDICDVAFNTKNPKNTEVENTDHYIPNIIVVSIIVLLLKHFSTNDNIKNILIHVLTWFITFGILFISISSVYLSYNYEDPKKEKSTENIANKELDLGIKI
jgi:hypothetical protein